MITTLIYASQKTGTCSNHDVQNILGSARKNNPRLGITGILLEKNDTFIQILEGEKSAIETLVEKIRQDPRHQNFKILRRGITSKRAFTGWDMAFKDLNKLDVTWAEDLFNIATHEENYQHYLDKIGATL